MVAVLAPVASSISAVSLFIEKQLSYAVTLCHSPDFFDGAQIREKLVTFVQILDRHNRIEKIVCRPVLYLDS